MSRRQHTWLRIGAVALIVGLQLLPRAPHNGSSTVTVAATTNADTSSTSASHDLPTGPAAAVVVPSTELAIAEP